MADIIHVLVVDNYPLFRVGLQNTLVAHYQVSEWATMQQAYSWSSEKAPGIVFLGNNLPGFGLPDTLMEWQSYFPESRFILILSDEEEVCARRLLESGAAGCLLREEMPEQFIQAVAAVAQGNTWFKPSLVQRALQTDTKPFIQGDALTEREIAALSLVLADKSNPEIAAILHLAPRTVGDILGSIYAKLSVRTRAGAVAKAFRLGLLEI